MFLKINGKTYDNFSSYSIVLKYDSIASSFRFDGLKDILPEQLSYSDIEIFKDNNLLLSGTVITNNYTSSAQPQLVSFSGYSKPGILEDCNIPPELYPLQNDNLSLRQICNKLLPKFELSFIADNIIKKDFEAPFKKINANITSTIKDFLSKIAAQKGIIVSHTTDGKLLFTKKDFDSFVRYKFIEGESDIENISLNVNGQAFHSDITILKQASANDRSNGQTTVRNPIVKKYRPFVKISNSGTVFDTEKAAKMQRSKELSTLKFNFNSKTFLMPGELIEFKAPSININNSIELYVEQNTIIGNQNGEKYSYICVLKETYTLEEPKDIFKK